ncbi:hypothetical protein B0H14DRAFT_2830336 [Mycena olivaceomarginata]|nr:hypothetical protein B0H14DRAFT_2830336 [Mycena olivaceomarginata]
MLGTRSPLSHVTDVLQNPSHIPPSPPPSNYISSAVLAHFTCMPIDAASHSTPTTAPSLSGLRRPRDSARARPRRSYPRAARSRTACTIRAVSRPAPPAPGTRHRICQLLAMALRPLPSSNLALPPTLPTIPSYLIVYCIYSSISLLHTCTYTLLCIQSPRLSR